MPIAAISLALGIVKLITWTYSTLWGPAPRLEAKIAYLEKKKAIAKAERARLQETYKKIDATPPPVTDQELQDRINDAWNQPKPPTP